MSCHTLIVLAGAGVALGPGASSSVAAPVLLGTMTTGMSWASSEVVGPHWPVLLYWGEDYDPPIVIFESFELEDDFPIEIHDTVSSANDPEFEAFTALMTDGVGAGQEVYYGAWGENGLTAAGGAPEEFFFDALMDFLVPRLGPDFVGYNISHITQDLIVDMESDWEGPDGYVYATYWSFGGTYEFYGTPIPEPATLVLVAVGFLGVAGRRVGVR